MSPFSQLSVSYKLKKHFSGVAVSIARAIVLLDLDVNPGMPTSCTIVSFEFTNRTPGNSGSGVELACWSTAEAAVALLCACLPMQRSLFGHVYEKLTSWRGTQKRWTQKSSSF